MSRMPTILLGSVLLCLVAWTVLLLGESPLGLQLNADLVKLLGHPDSTANYARAIFMLLGVLVAAGVGGGIGWSLRAVSAAAREIELLSRLNATKGRIPRLESGMRSKEMQVERVEEQMHNLESLLPPLYKTIKERDQALRDHEAMVLRLQQELSVWKRTPLVDEATTLDGNAVLDSDRAAGPIAGNAVLDARVRTLESDVGEREARIADLMRRILQLESALDDAHKRSADYDRERQRQDKWLDVLNDQLARARETNDRLTAGVHDQTALQQRINQLEADVKRLTEELSDSERRLAASRFECATARTTIAHLQGRLEKARGGQSAF
jgi:chromosome segregation ATPase